MWISWNSKIQVLSLSSVVPTTIYRIIQAEARPSFISTQPTESHPSTVTDLFIGPICLQLFQSLLVPVKHVSHVFAHA